MIICQGNEDLDHPPSDVRCTGWYGDVKIAFWGMGGGGVGEKTTGAIINSFHLHLRVTRTYMHDSGQVLIPAYLSPEIPRRLATGACYTG